jgi:hypothetical protein
MCCFSRPVKLVAKTNIFARASTKGRQFLVYSMLVDAAEELAMILPMPVPKDTDDDAVRFINLEEYADFFDEMRSGFPETVTSGRGNSFDEKRPRPNSKLEVVKVGSFEASFVPSIADFSRLDERFRLPTEVWEKLPMYKHYGFAVFQLMKEKQGAQKVHPMAFEFPRAKPKQLFFPTVHIHDGTVHATADFDHFLYCQASAGENVMMWQESPQPLGMFMKKHEQSQGLLDPKAHCYRKMLNGELKNQDTVV